MNHNKKLLQFLIDENISISKAIEILEQENKKKEKPWVAQEKEIILKYEKR